MEHRLQEPSQSPNRESFPENEDNVRRKQRKESTDVQGHLRTWLAYPATYPELSSPGTGLPFSSPICHSLYNPAILATPVLFYPFSPFTLLASWSPGSHLCLLVSWLSPPCCPHMARLRVMFIVDSPDVSASSYTLLHIYNKSSPLPHLEVMCSFYFFFHSPSTMTSGHQYTPSIYC